MIHQGSSSQTESGKSPSDPLPLIAVTMGDAAGVGPEIVVAAALDESVRRLCRLIVIGDAARLAAAASILGVDIEIVRVDGTDDIAAGAGRLHVIDLALIPDDLPWGKLSPVAGDAAFQYVRRASEMALTGEVNAICTAPLNKEALHAAGHAFPGHTELLAHLTGADEVSMMLATPELRVIHVTTHVGLLDAIRTLDPEQVLRTIRRGATALRRAGIPAPRVAVCAVNPHAGENGLFGNGEEDERIAPAIAQAAREGIDVSGPHPADTVFYRASRGDFDLVVAMYHDQGHIPVKMLGIDAGTNITVGLPVIRTSVDHGTAFDIAGTGRADPTSMVRALEQAALLASVA